MLRFISCAIVLMCIGVLHCSAGGNLPGKIHNEKAFSYYLYKTMYSSCIADNFMKEMENGLRKAYRGCYAQMRSLGKNGRRAYYQELLTKTAAPDSQQTTSTPVNRNKRTTTGAQNDGARIPHYTADVIRNLKKDVFLHVNLLSCVLSKQMNLTVSADSGLVDATRYVEYSFEKNPIFPQDVKEKLVNGAKKCVAESSRKDNMKWGSAYQDFHKIANYFRCVSKLQVEVCFKLDLLGQKDKFQLEGLEGHLSDTNLENQLAFIVSAYANWDSTGVWDM